MRVKPTQRMHAALMALLMPGFPKHVAKEFISDGEFEYTRVGLFFYQHDTGYAARWDGKQWVTVEYVSKN